MMDLALTGSLASVPPSRARPGSLPARAGRAPGHNGPPRPTRDFKHPKLTDGVLTIKGTAATTGSPCACGPDSPTSSRSTSATTARRIQLQAEGRREHRRSTPATATTRQHRRGERCLHGHARRRSTAAPGTTARRRLRRRDPDRRRGDDSIDGNRGDDTRSWALATTRSSGIRATAATSSRARTAATRCSSTAPTAPSIDLRPTAAG